jgi:hypothetical protein
LQSTAHAELALFHLVSLGSHVCTVFPEHCVVPAVQTGVAQPLVAEQRPAVAHVLTVVQLMPSAAHCW